MNYQKEVVNKHEPLSFAGKSVCHTKGPQSASEAMSQLRLLIREVAATSVGSDKGDSTPVAGSVAASVTSRILSPPDIAAALRTHLGDLIRRSE